MDAFLKGIHIGDVIFEKKELLRINDTATLEEFNEKLVQNNILSLPVWCEQEEKYLGILDVLDLVSFIASKAEKADEKLAHEIEWKFPNWGTTTVGELLVAVQYELPLSRDCNIYIFEPFELILNLLKPFGSGKVHRVLVKVKDEQEMRGTTYRLLSQTDVVKYLYNHHKNLDQNLLGKTIDQLGLTKGAIHTISKTETVLDGLRKMHLLGDLSALAVVDERRRLVSNFSASDLRGLTSDKLTRLDLPVIDFLKLSYGNKPMNTITCTAHTPFRSIIQSMTENKIHRVWIVDSFGKPEGVVTLSDVIRTFLASPYYTTAPPNIQAE